MFSDTVQCNPKNSKLSLQILFKTKFSNSFIVHLRPADCVVGSSVVKTSVVVVGGGVVVPSKFFDFSTVVNDIWPIEKFHSKI